MATIVTKNSSTAASVPLAVQLTKGELAVNVTDKRVFTKDNSGAVVEVGTNPSAVSLPNGTANGVAYLNGSKALTSGSALTFDGLTLSNSSGSTPFSLNRTGSGTAHIELKQSGTVGSYLGTSGANDFIVYSGTGAELSRLTSTGLGIGTSSPGAKLDVNGDARVGNATAGTNRQLSINGVVNKASRISFQESGIDRWLLGNGAASENGNFEIYDATSGNNFVLTRAGNLGLGVTPSAWSLSNSSALQVRNAGLMGFSNSAYLTANLFNSAGTWKYIAAASASLYVGNAGSHEWHISTGAPSAGGTATLTQAMTLDASGNLGVGTSSPTFAAGTGLQVKGAGFTSVRVTGGALTGTDLSQDASGGYLYVRDNLPLMFGTNNTERARIDSSGNLFLKNSSGDAVIGNSATGGMYLGGGSANTNLMVFQVGSSERARITSSGDLLVGTTSAGGRLTVSQTTSGVFPVATRGADRGVDVQMTGTSGISAYFTTSSGSVFAGQITVSGSTTSYGTSSDHRLKEDIQPMTGALAKVQALKPCTYRWKADGSDGEGFIAHELAEVVPQCVTGEKDAVDADGKPVYQGIDTSFLVATLTAAIQEQQALIQSLTQRLAALEGASNA